jgi:glycosyltransferase involved in cell wall biosynthesis
LKDQRKHIVLIAAWFFPENRVASYRMNSFAKYLDRSRFKVTVISLQHGSSASINNEFSDVTVYREPYNSIFRIRQQMRGVSRLKHKFYALNNKLITRFFLEDYPSWSKAVNNRLNNIHKEQQIDLIISSYAPVDAHIAAYTFKKNNSRVKWIADMRDEMSLNPFISKRSKGKLAELEQKCSPYIDALTTVSEPIMNGFGALMKNDNIVFRELRNGFDHDLAPKGNFNTVFTLLYAGTFYGKRKPDTLFTALISLMKEGEINSFFIRLAGTHRNFTIPSELDQHIKFLPHLSNEDAVDQMMLADCNLLIHPPMGVKGVYTGKLFEYLSTGKPVLALVDTEDVAAKLINEMNAGEVVDFYDVDGIKKAILKIHSDWKEHNLPKVDPEKIKKLHRKHQVSLLEELIDEIL